MRTIGNFLWFICGGLVMGLVWWFCALLCFASIVCIPWGRACFVIGKMSFFPFGKEAISRRELTGIDDIGTGSAGMLGNLVWFLLGGMWLALGHACIGLFYCLSVIGIPFGLQHFKLGGIALAPIGKTIVSSEVAAAARAANAAAVVSDARRRV